MSYLLNISLYASFPDAKAAAAALAKFDKAGPFTVESANMHRVYQPEPGGCLAEPAEDPVEEPAEMPSDDTAAAALSSELIQFCRSQLADVKCPRSIDFREELPRHPTGKLYKRLLKDEYWSAAGRAI